MIDYQQIIDDSQSTPFKIAGQHKGMSMFKHSNPVSIAEPEFKFIQKFIKDNNLQRGFEVATAFGISALAAGLGFKETGGILVTMDAYIEEQFNNCSAYESSDRRTFKDSDGYKTANYLFQKYEVQDHIRSIVGYSPDNTANAIESTFTDMLDYAFIDALHLDESLIKDFDAVFPFLAKKCAVFFHDVHCFAPHVKDHITNKMGKEWEVVSGCAHPGEGYNLALINNL